MRKVVYIYLIAQLTFVQLYAQNAIVEYTNDSSVIRIKEYYKGYGKIFNESINTSNMFDYYKSNFTPTIDQILKAEKALIWQYNMVHKNDKRDSDSYTEIKDPQDHLKHYYRQYFGLIDNKNEHVILIHLMNFKKKSKAKKYFKN